MKDSQVCGLALILLLNGGGPWSIAQSTSTVVAWGDNTYGQRNVPPGLTDAVAIAAGRYHNVALKADGTVVTWGDNSSGQTTLPAGLNSVMGIGAGSLHSLAVKSNGTVVAWGYNYYGQSTVPPGLTEVRAISGGGNHSLALKSNGTVVAWGDNTYGQRNVPSTLTNAMAIAAGWDFCLALRSNRTVVGWGYNDFGEINVPTGLTNVVAIATGWDHCLALKTDGRVAAWGYNNSGQTTVPSGLANVVAIAAGANSSLALKSDGQVVAWGNNSSGQGNVPAWLSNVAAIVQGGAHSVALVAVRPPVLSCQPECVIVQAGATATFSVCVEGSLPLAYQWFFNETSPLAGATNATLTIPNVQADDVGDYHVVVTNAYGAVTSQVACLELVYPPTITLQPTNVTVVAGENALFTVEVTNNATLPIGFQLRKSSVILSNVVLSTRACTLTLFTVTTNATTTNGPGTYRVVTTNVANASPGVGSVTVTLKVLPATPPAVTTLAASNVTASTADLRGSVNPNGGTTTAWFEYGLTTGYGAVTAVANVGNSSNAVEVCLSVDGLLSSTDYHCRLVATNYGNYGTVTVGDDMVLATGSPLPPAPTIGACALLGNGCFHLQFAGQVGASYTVLCSTNLIEWAVAGTATETPPGAFEFTDTNAPQHATCSYRLRSP